MKDFQSISNEIIFISLKLFYKMLKNQQKPRDVGVDWADWVKYWVNNLLDKELDCNWLISFDFVPAVAEPSLPKRPAETFISKREI